MPSTSQKQHNAMEAAAHGKSTLGIPKSVGQDFANADKGKSFSLGGSTDLLTRGTAEGPRNASNNAYKANMVTRDKSGPKLPLDSDWKPKSKQTDGASFDAGGAIGVMPTMGVSSSYPPPQGKRPQGPRNYGKK